MFGWIAGLLQSKEGQVAVAVTAVYAINATLTGVKKGLEKIKDKTETKLDDQAYALVSKVIGWSDTAIAFLTANTTYLPPKAKAIVDNKGEEPAQPPQG